MKNDCVKNEVNHKGNFKISVSFDVFSELSDKAVERYVQDLEKNIRLQFLQFKLNESANKEFGIQVKNVKWNE